MILLSILFKYHIEITVLILIYTSIINRKGNTFVGIAIFALRRSAWQLLQVEHLLRAIVCGSNSKSCFVIIILLFYLDQRVASKSNLNYNKQASKFQQKGPCTSWIISPQNLRGCLSSFGATLVWCNSWTRKS